MTETTTEGAPQSTAATVAGGSGRGEWELDPAHSHVGFTGTQMMISTVRGRFNEFSASLELDENSPESATIEARIQAPSLDSGFEYRDTHLKSPDFLDAENHPEIVFRSTRIERADGADDRFRLHGDLTIRGDTRPVVLDTEFHGIIPGEPGTRRAAFGARTTISRGDWGLNWNMPLGSGGVLVGDQVMIEIEATFIQRLDS